MNSEQEFPDAGPHLAIQDLPPRRTRSVIVAGRRRMRSVLMTCDGAFDRLYYNDRILRNEGMNRLSTTGAECAILACHPSTTCPTASRLTWFPSP